MNLSTRFKFGDRVVVDGEPTLVATVVGYSMEPRERVSVKLSWFSNGAHHEYWFDEFRLEPEPPEKKVGI